MNNSLQKLKKYMFISLGILSLILGVIGILLPVLPTTPFLLIAAFLFYKSSKKLHDWLIGNKILGEYIYNYHKYHAIKRRAKIVAIILLWISLSVSAILVPLVIVRIGLLVVGIAVTIHLLSIKTLEKVQIDE